ncbi:MAG TPA: hypothetical protein VF139_09130 [Candidatus Polarisedimenticolaceae bacterium]
MNRPLAAAALALLVALSPGCARKEIRGEVSTGLDRKLSTFAFIEDGDLVAFIVDVRATQYREKDAYIPFEVAIANRGFRSMTLTRESFVLVDEQGNRYPAASPKELLQGYEFLDLDRRLAEISDITFNKFSTFTRYRSKFSPTRQVPQVPGEATLVQDTVVLPKFGYLIDFLYFPTPPGGVKGKKFEMFLKTPELPDAVYVKFQVN